MTIKQGSMSPDAARGELIRKLREARELAVYLSLEDQASNTRRWYALGCSIEDCQYSVKSIESKNFETLKEANDHEDDPPKRVKRLEDTPVLDGQGNIYGMKTPSNTVVIKKLNEVIDFINEKL